MVKHFLPPAEQVVYLFYIFHFRFAKNSLRKTVHCTYKNTGIMTLLYTIIPALAYLYLYF